MDSYGFLWTPMASFDCLATSLWCNAAKVVMYEAIVAAVRSQHCGYLFGALTAEEGPDVVCVDGAYTFQ